MSEPTVERVLFLVCLDSGLPWLPTVIRDRDLFVICLYLSCEVLVYGTDSWTASCERSRVRVMLWEIN